MRHTFEFPHPPLLSFRFVLLCVASWKNILLISIVAKLKQANETITESKSTVQTTI